MSYISWQLENYGKVIDVPETDYEIVEVENGLQQQEQFTDWFEQQAELELMKND